MEKLKSVGAFLLSIVGFLALITLSLLFVYGAGWVSAHLLRIFTVLSLIGMVLLFLVLLPLSAIRKVRPVTGPVIYLLSYVFGITVWMEGLLVTLSTWGTGAVIFGLMFMGVGVVPIGMLAALFHGLWPALTELVLLMILTFGCRIFGQWSAEHYQSRV